MEVIVAKSGGFCSGVRKAVDTALSVSPENTYIYGEIIHNARVVDQINARGLKTVDSLDEVPDGAKLLIRSHGAGKGIYDECERRNIEIIDCTCPFVKKTQKIVDEQYRQNKTVVIIGERTHPEVVGLNGWCENRAYVFSSDEDDFSLLPPENLVIVAQTTFSEEKFEKIIKILLDKRGKTVEVFRTICYTTICRQNEANELSSKCDAVLVIGGLNSSNTNKLYEICRKNCKHVFRLNNTDEADYSEIIRYKKVGIVTGASTPDTQTQEVLLKMEAEAKASATMQDVVDEMDNQPRFKKGQLITATISTADDQGVQVLLPNAKKEIVLDKSEVDCENYDKNAFLSKVGQEIELMVLAVNPVKLSQKLIKKVKEEEALLEEVKAGNEFSVTCTGFNKGGLTSELGSYTVFVPAKEIRPGYVKDFEKYVGKKLRLKVIEIKKERRKEIIASQRVILEAERAEKEAIRAQKDAEFFASIAVGDVVEGKVERTTSFGAFVSVNGFDCLAHISDLSWTGANKVEDVLQIGTTYQFKVLKIDQESKKVSIGYKQLQPKPWDLVAEKYVEGDVIHGKVVRIVPFGAFVEVEKGIDGLVHVSQISHDFLENANSVLTIGQEIDAKILKLNPEENKMTLSIKALLPRPERTDKKDKKGDEEKGQVELSDEMTEWKDDDLGGASISDLLKTND